MEIYEKIRTVRLEKSINQQVLADVLGVDVTVISNIELGKRQVRFNELEKIAKVMKISLIDLITYPKKYVEKEERPEQVQAVLQIRLSKEKRDQILQQVLGDIEILDSL